MLHTVYQIVGAFRLGLEVVIFLDSNSEEADKNNLPYYFENKKNTRDLGSNEY